MPQATATLLLSLASTTWCRLTAINDDYVGTLVQSKSEGDLRLVLFAGVSDTDEHVDEDTGKSHRHH
jgi:hypothetical protein